MTGKCTVYGSIAIVVSALLITCMVEPVQAYRICTFKGTVVENGWRSMTVKSNGQCAEVNVGWRTKFVPNRRPCLGENVAVDFILEDGYMKATKVVSLSPIPSAAQCYPPAPPSGSVCRSVGEEPSPIDSCTPPKPVVSTRPPAHVSDPSWSPSGPSTTTTPPPSSRKPAAPRSTEPQAKPSSSRSEAISTGPTASAGPGAPTTPSAPPKKPVGKTATGEKKVIAKTTPVERPAAPKEEVSETAPKEEKSSKTLTGEVVASSPKSLSLRVSDDSDAAEVVSVRVGLKTKFIPFRRPAVGEKVKIEYRQENGDKFGYTVQVVQ